MFFFIKTMHSKTFFRNTNSCGNASFSIYKQKYLNRSLAVPSYKYSKVAWECPDKVPQHQINNRHQTWDSCRHPDPLCISCPKNPWLFHRTPRNSEE